jgi:hypothetical protein
MDLQERSTLQFKELLQTATRLKKLAPKAIGAGQRWAKPLGSNQAFAESASNVDADIVCPSVA